MTNIGTEPREGEAIGQSPSAPPMMWLKCSLYALTQFLILVVSHKIAGGDREYALPLAAALWVLTSLSLWMGCIRVQGFLGMVTHCIVGMTLPRGIAVQLLPDQPVLALCIWMTVFVLVLLFADRAFAQMLRKDALRRLAQ